MNTPNLGNGGGGRKPANPDPLAQVRSEGRRVVDSDINQLRSNDRTLTSSAGNPNLKNVSSSKEFDRQMRRESLKHKGKATPQAFKQVGAKMVMAGYSEQSIRRAMRHYNRNFSRMKPHEFNRHFNRHVRPALRHPKVQRARTQNQAFKQQHGIPQTYRNMQGLQKINTHVQKQQRQQKQALAQRQQRQIAQNRKQAVQKAQQITRRR